MAITVPVRAVAWFGATVKFFPYERHREPRTIVCETLVGKSIVNR